MSWSVTIGRVAGTAIRIHITFLMFLAWIGFSALQQGGADAALRNVVFIVALFLCVLLHEFGHILTARRFGIATPDVTLLPIGGVASLERIPEKPSQELLVAIAGPAVNLVIASLLILVAGSALPAGATTIDNPNVSLVARLAYANIFLAVFNMIPAFPMDGGRVLHAVLAMKLGPKRALQIAARIGQGLAFVFGFAGLFGNPFLVFIGIFIYIAASGEARDTVFRDTIKGLLVRDAMETRVASIPIGATIGDAVDILLATPQHEFPVVDGHGKPTGLLTREAIIGALTDRTREAPIADIAHDPIPTLRAGQDLEKGLADLNTARAPAISVVDVDGVLVGLLTRENIAEMMLIAQARPDWSFRREA